MHGADGGDYTTVCPRHLTHQLENLLLDLLLEGQGADRGAHAVALRQPLLTGGLRGLLCGGISIAHQQRLGGAREEAPVEGLNGGGGVVDELKLDQRAAAAVVFGAGEAVGAGDRG